uniref:(northern house mosquito) hypothetical protein n=1 Tax=Culex pipiens TaxID=7175 RepID=A0A8D8B2G5_CULPI
MDRSLQRFLHLPISQQIINTLLDNLNDIFVVILRFLNRRRHFLFKPLQRLFGGTSALVRVMHDPDKLQHLHRILFDDFIRLFLRHLNLLRVLPAKLLLHVAVKIVHEALDYVQVQVVIFFARQQRLLLLLRNAVPIGTIAFLTVTVVSLHLYGRFLRVGHLEICCCAGHGTPEQFPQT